MDKTKNTRPSKEVKEQKPQLQKEDSKKSVQDRSENNFDFGGLPMRDLKKNLGCG